MQAVKGSDRNEQGQCRVEASRYAHHYVLGSGVFQPFDQSRNLYVENLFAAFVEHLLNMRDKGVRVVVGMSFLRLWRVIFTAMVR